jgi:uncharacterized SAM-binding protein YcdF (DUF218 family)
MRDLLLQLGVPPEHIRLEDRSSDTLSSVRACAEIVRTLPDRGQVFVCSDRYHIPRCRWLFYLYGIPTKAGQVENGRKAVGLARWIYYCVREVPAFIVDTVLVGIGALLHRPHSIPKVRR